MAAEDLCTLADVLVEADMSSLEAAPDEAKLEEYITDFSKAITSFCKWSFHDETIEDEVFMAPNIIVNAQGQLMIYTRKANIRSVDELSWKVTPRSSYQEIDPLDILVFPSNDETVNENSGLVRVVGQFSGLRNQYSAALMQVKMSYVGGFDPIPGAVKRAAAKMAWWAYKQRDVVPQGKTAIPQLGVLVIPDAWPNYVISLLNNYKRVTL